MALDEVAASVLRAVDPWDAYRAASAASGALTGALDWLPRGGALYVAWADLTDLFEAGKTPVPDALAVLRDAAARWQQWSAAPSGPGLAAWLEDTTEATTALRRRDGDFWRQPDEG